MACKITSLCFTGFFNQTNFLIIFLKVGTIKKVTVVFVAGNKLEVVCDSAATRVSHILQVCTYGEFFVVIFIRKSDFKVFPYFVLIEGLLLFSLHEDFSFYTMKINFCTKILQRVNNGFTYFMT